MAKNYEELANQILANVGGTSNVSFATHCMTRLRLNLKDESLVNDEEIKKINGVLGSQFSGGQYQVIIGQDVPKLYDEICSIGGFAKQDAISENLDKKSLTLKGIGNAIMDAISGCLSPLIPVLMAAGMIKMIIALFGPDMLNLISAESDLYTVLTFVGDAGFYFFPIFVAYSGSKKFGCSPIIALMVAGILIHPTYVEMVNNATAFTIYGIPVTLTAYSSTVIPMILCTFVMSYVEKGLKKFIPTVLSTVFTPLLEILIMLPLAFCVLGPLGGFIGNGLATVLTALYNVAGPIGIGVIGALWLPLVATGMHMALVSVAIVNFATIGYDPLLAATVIAIYADIAVDLAMMIKAKNAEDKALAGSCLIAQALGGVGEPTIFGILFRYKKAFAWVMVGSFAGALVNGFLHVNLYLVTASNFLNCLAFGQDLVKGLIGCAVGFAVTFALTMIFGYEDKKEA